MSLASLAEWARQEHERRDGIALNVGGIGTSHVPTIGVAYDSSLRWCPRNRAQLRGRTLKSSMQLITDRR
jgi:hypothetical protein